MRFCPHLYNGCIRKAREEKDEGQLTFKTYQRSLLIHAALERVVGHTRRKEMDLGLKGKIAVVTGSSRGIGKGIALGLAAEGCNLVICARGEDALRATAKEIEAEGSKVLMLPLDVTQKETANQIVRQTLATFLRPGTC